MPTWIQNEPEAHCSDAEIKVARILRFLPRDWIIRWGFFYHDEQETRREGDFLILIPSAGLLVLEVKGGKPRHFGPTGKWTGPDDANPLRQLDHEHGAILREAKTGPLGKIYIAKALCYPEETLTPEEAPTCRGLDWDSVISGGDLATPKTFSAALQRVFQPRVKKLGGLRPVTPEIREEFLQRFGQASTPQAIEAFLDHNEARIRQQITAEYRLIDLLSANRQLIIEGGPGSGKSWYALEQARRYAGEGLSVLFLVYNRALTTTLRQDIARTLPPSSQGSVEVLNFEELAARLLGIPVEQLLDEATSSEDATRFWEVELPTRMLESVRKSNVDLLPKFDALVADEGQDHDTELHSEIAARFPEFACGWWSLYWRLLRDETSALMAIFFDRAQRPSFRDASRFQPERLRSFLSQPALVQLDRSLRYTRELFEFLTGLNGEGIEALVDGLGDGKNLLPGPAVLVTPAKSESAELKSQLVALLEQWEEGGLTRPEDVLILHNRSLIEDSPLHDAAPPDTNGTRWLGPYRLHPEGSPGPGLRHCSIHKAKGLDARAIILLGIPSPTSEELRAGDRFTLFMGASRARQLLAILHK